MRMRLLQKNKSNSGMFLRALLDVRQRNEIILLYLPLEKPQWKYCIQFGALHLKAGVYQLEIIHKKAAVSNRCGQAGKAEWTSLISFRKGKRKKEGW